MISPFGPGGCLCAQDAPASPAKGSSDVDIEHGAGKELFDRMKALVDFMVAAKQKHADYYTRHGYEAWQQAEEIAALANVLRDPDLIEARSICADVMTMEDDSLGAAFIYKMISGREDSSNAVKIALTAIKRGRSISGDRS